MTSNTGVRTVLNDGDETRATSGMAGAILIQVPDGGTATLETRNHGSGTEFHAVSGTEIASGDPSTGTFAEGAYILDSLGNGVPSLRVTGSDVVMVSL